MRYVRGLLSDALTWSFLFTLFAILTILPLPASGEEPASCGQAVPLARTDSFYGYGDTAGAVEYFAVDVPWAGVLVVEAVTPVSAVVEPKLALFDQRCRPVERAGKGFTVIERRISGIVVAIKAPGTWRVGVAAQDPRQALGDYRLLTRFVEVTKGGVEEPDPDPEPDGLTTGCQYGEIDDHGDTLSCATELLPGEKTMGELGRNDGDVFQFVLARQRTVSIESFGDTDARGALYDHHGHRLAFDGDSVDGSGIRIVRTLGPGRYFVRVEGAGGAEGVYTLRVTDLGW